MLTFAHTLRLMLAVTAAATAVLPVASAAQEQAQPKVAFNLPRMSLDKALKEVGRRSGREIMYPEELVRGKTAAALAMEVTAEEAVRQLLQGSGLQADFRPDVIIIRGRGSFEVETGPPANPDVVVTGTRIRGGEPASPQINVSRETMRAQGFTDLGGFARSLPQNFAGGQNPGVVGGGAQGPGNENVTSSSTLNLRGLGPDATLTLINGHRVAFDAVSQGIDISAVPLLAVERVEIVTDGASAIYGSDAVGGVANVILRKSFDGVLTSARVGAATEGGGTQDQFDVVAGADWSSGQIVAALSYLHATTITAGQRSFTQSLDQSFSLLPQQEQVSGVLTLGQQLGHRARLDLDAQFNRRTSLQTVPFSTTNSYLVSGYSIRPRVGSFAISPSLTVDLSEAWRLTASGSYSESDTSFANRLRSASTEIARTDVNYANRLVSGEIGAEGRLFAAPGGDVRLSIGAGHRSNGLRVGVSRLAGGTRSTVLSFDRSQDVTFAYGELFAPLVGADNAKPLLQRLSLSAAARYERYANADDLVTPKLGLVYEPFAPLTLKATFGRSFKAPTLYQLNMIRNGGLIRASSVGQTPPVATDAVVLISGGNPNLAPERATTWSATAEIAPTSKAVELSASYYHIQFANRVVSPIASAAGILTNPLYRQLVVFNPTPAQIAAAAATLPLGLVNQTPLPVSSLNVLALIDNSLQNAAGQTIHGVDLAGRVALAATTAGRLSLDVNASYLHLEQRLSVGQPLVELSGTVFRPPHWRARGAVEWESPAFSASSVINYLGPNEDRRLAPFAPGRPYATLDLTAQLRTRTRTGAAAGLEATFSVLNVFDRKPDNIRNGSATNPPYDSTNYSAVGRTVNFTIAKRW